jgi:hypothetical protein
MSRSMRGILRPGDHENPGEQDEQHQSVGDLGTHWHPSPQGFGIPLSDNRRMTGIPKEDNHVGGRIQMYRPQRFTPFG